MIPVLPKSVADQIANARITVIESVDPYRLTIGPEAIEQHIKHGLGVNVGASIASRNKFISRAEIPNNDLVEFRLEAVVFTPKEFHDIAVAIFEEGVKKGGAR